MAGSQLRRDTRGMAKVPRHRKGYATVSVRLVVPDLDEQVQFLRAVFGAQGEVVAGRPAELRIGDSTVMVTEVGERDAAGNVDQIAHVL